LTIEEIYSEFGKMVFNLALQYVQNTEDAEELTQDVFLTVHEKNSSFHQDSKLSTWIYRITINKALDFIKAKKRAKRFAFFSSLFIDQVEHKNSVFSDFNHPGVQMEQKEGIQKIFDALNDLPEQQKTVVILLKIEQLSQKEVAEIMNLSVKAVESLYQRAKKNLSKKL